MLSNESLYPSKQANRRDKKHPLVKYDDANALSAERTRYDRVATLPHIGFLPEEKPAFQYSYEVAYQIAECKKPRTIVEYLIKSCVKKLVESMIGPEVKNNFQKVFTLTTTFFYELKTWLLMCASKFAVKSSKVISRQAFDWTSEPTFLFKAT